MITFKNSCDGCFSDSLDVRFTRACDNNCTFCIEKKGVCAKPVNVERMIQSTINCGKKDILILGGEPLLEMEKLLRYVKGVRQFVRNIYITTSLPNTIKSHWDEFCSIMDSIDGLNVSLQHYDSSQNNDILQASNRHNRIDYLKEICENEDYAQKCRISINLVKDSIDSKEEIDMFLTKMETINVKHVKINELQDSEDIYVSFEKAYGIKMKSPFAHGCQTEIKLDNYDLKITLKRACFCVNKKLNASLMDFAKVIGRSLRKKSSDHQIVLYEDGTLEQGWIVNL